MYVKEKTASEKSGAEKSFYDVCALNFIIKTNAYALQDNDVTTPHSAPLLGMGILNCGFKYNLYTARTRKYCKKKTRAKIFSNATI